MSASPQADVNLVGCLGSITLHGVIKSTFIDIDGRPCLKIDYGAPGEDGRRLPVVIDCGADGVKKLTIFNDDGESMRIRVPRR